MLGTWVPHTARRFRGERRRGRGVLGTYFTRGEGYREGEGGRGEKEGVRYIPHTAVPSTARRLRGEGGRGVFSHSIRAEDGGRDWGVNFSHSGRVVVRKGRLVHHYLTLHEGGGTGRSCFKGRGYW